MLWEDDEPWTADKEQLRATVHHGALPLGTDGCGMEWCLVVTGPERGQIWQLTSEGAQPLAPRRTFLSWYEYWLEGGSDW